MQIYIYKIVTLATILGFVNAAKMAEREVSPIIGILNEDSTKLGQEIQLVKQFRLRDLLAEKMISQSRKEKDGWFYTDFIRWLNNAITVASNAFQTAKVTFGSSSTDYRLTRQAALARLQDKYDYLSGALDDISGDSIKQPVKDAAGISHKYLYEARLNADIAKLKDELGQMNGLSLKQIGEQYKQKIRDNYVEPQTKPRSRL